MPITYTIDADAGLIMARPTGTLTTEETLEYFSRLVSDPDCPDSGIEIVDFSGVSRFEFDYPRLSRITREYQFAKSAKRIPATIFICTAESHYGIGRMLESLHETANPGHIVRLIKTHDELDETIRELKSEIFPDSR